MVSMSYDALEDISLLLLLSYARNTASLISFSGARLIVNISNCIMPCSGRT